MIKSRPLHEGVDWNICQRPLLPVMLVSPSSRGRGLKSHKIRFVVFPLEVALFTRAWIEILYSLSVIIFHPVALFTRAWIEITILANQGVGVGVALFTRAWIEITKSKIHQGQEFVALFTRAWIEIPKAVMKVLRNWSPSSRGRGLKLRIWYRIDVISVSPSSRGRGLKYCVVLNFADVINVALFTRAWIEIVSLVKLHPICSCRPLHEGVDWNTFSEYIFRQRVVALFTRAWIEIIFISPLWWYNRVALFTRAWIEILCRQHQQLCHKVALFTRAWIEINITTAFLWKAKVALFTRAWIEIF